MAAAAVALCRATRYRNAGTVDFVVDADTLAFYFLEMNTRIQVEHPVTEMITGRSIAMQIDLARRRLAGCRNRPLPAAVTPSRRGSMPRIRQSDFMPSPGRLARFRPPHGENVSGGSGYREGDTITPFYDPIVAKVIAHGGTRDEARRTLIAALQAFEIDGIRSSRGFLIAC